jgi:hypothetical protein
VQPNVTPQHLPQGTGDIVPMPGSLSQNTNANTTTQGPGQPVNAGTFGSRYTESGVYPNTLAANATSVQAVHVANATVTADVNTNTIIVIAQPAVQQRYADLIARLDTLYDSKPDSAALEAGRAAAGVWAREQLEGPVGARFRSYKIGRMPARPVNNARLIGATLYRTLLDLFDRWFENHNRDVRVSVSALDTLMQGAEGDSAFARLRQAVGDTTTPR